MFAQGGGAGRLTGLCFPCEPVVRTRAPARPFRSHPEGIEQWPLEMVCDRASPAGSGV